MRGYCLKCQTGTDLEVLKNGEPHLSCDKAGYCSPCWRGLLKTALQEALARAEAAEAELKGLVGCLPKCEDGGRMTTDGPCQATSTRVFGGTIYPPEYFCDAHLAGDDTPWAEYVRRHAK